MKITTWINKNIPSLQGKRVAITGSTGGIGRQLCSHLATLGAELILMDRNIAKSKALADELRLNHPDLAVEFITTDLEDMDSVKAACEHLKELSPHVIIHNAGAYHIPRHKCSTGYDNVFQINFIAPYFMTRELLPTLRENGGRVIAVGSVAHNYSESDPADEDFSNRTRSSLVYGNAKRYLMFALHELFREEKGVRFALTHPGITVTNITAHYPRVIYALIKYPMKVIFMSPKKAALSILAGVSSHTDYHEWVGPKLFDVWGFPRKRLLRTASSEECGRIARTACRIYEEISNQ